MIYPLKRSNINWGVETGCMLEDDQYKEWQGKFPQAWPLRSCQYVMYSSGPRCVYTHSEECCNCLNAVSQRMEMAPVSVAGLRPSRSRVPRPRPQRELTSISGNSSVGAAPRLIHCDCIVSSFRGASSPGNSSPDVAHGSTSRSRIRINLRATSVPTIPKVPLPLDVLSFTLTLLGQFSLKCIIPLALVELSQVHWSESDLILCSIPSQVLYFLTQNGKEKEKKLPKR